MQLPDTNDDARALLAKLAANVGATVTANDDAREILATILAAIPA